MDLRIHGIDNKCYRLYAPELWQRIIPEKCKFKIKAEKDQLVVILAKVGTQDIHSTWEHLRKRNKKYEVCGYFVFKKIQST